MQESSQIATIPFVPGFMPNFPQILGSLWEILWNDFYGGASASGV
jgi:hypothetical protein